LRQVLNFGHRQEAADNSVLRRHGKLDDEKSADSCAADADRLRQTLRSEKIPLVFLIRWEAERQYQTVQTTASDTSDSELTLMSFDETYFDDTARVRLHCDGPDCWVEIRQKPAVSDGCGRTGTDMQSEVDIEFLLQPRDSAQRPVGGPLLLHVQHCRLTDDSRTGSEHAWSWLPPRLTPELLGRCHLRLRRDTLK